MVIGGTSFHVCAPEGANRNQARSFEIQFRDRDFVEFNLGKLFCSSAVCVVNVYRTSVGGGGTAVNVSAIGLYDIALVYSLYLKVCFCVVIRFCMVGGACRGSVFLYTVLNGFPG